VNHRLLSAWKGERNKEGLPTPKRQRPDNHSLGQGKSGGVVALSFRAEATTMALVRVAGGGWGLSRAQEKKRSQRFEFTQSVLTYAGVDSS